MDSAYAPLLFPIAFVSIWVGVIFIISHTGWRNFAQHYPAKEPDGRYHLARQARFSSIFGAYRNAVRVAFRAEGVYFSILFIFRPFHPPFLIPWTSVKSAERSDLLFLRRFVVAIDDPCGTIRLWLAASAEEDVRRFLPLA